MSDFSRSSGELRGLGKTEAEKRLKEEGANELPQAHKRTPFRIVIDVLREPMLALLIGGGIVYLTLGDLKEALILLAFAVLSIWITVVQEVRTERVLEALRDLTSPRAMVIRDGERKRIAGREVVRGDMIVLSEGDRVAADACLVTAQDLLADESLLTGEPVPVRKAAISSRRPETARPGGDDMPFVFGGSLIVRGSAIAEVFATGSRSEIGRIGQSLRSIEATAPNLQKQTRRLVGICALVGGMVSLVVVALYSSLRGSWLDGILAGIAVGMSMLPEEFPVVLTIFLAMGALRISKARVLTRRATAIETLGSATVLCTDKTGTLTENRMTITDLRLAGGSGHRVGNSALPLPDAFRKLVDLGALASAPRPFDPMEKAFFALAAHQAGTDRVLPWSSWKHLHTYPLRPDCLAVANAWKRDGDDDVLFVAAKGAPETIARLCRLSLTSGAALTKATEDMAGAGLRVLGVASATFAGATPPGNLDAFDFAFVGLVGLADPLRASVPAAIRECRTAGIRVVMITGDYPATARFIACEAGLDTGDVVSGDEMATMSDLELASRLKDTSVFARIMPEQKLRIVEALKANGEIVAMTGDGVNDAPSLKAAHIGIAMGGRGTDVAREASSIVLLDDDFGSIVTTIRLGRRIYDNLRKAMSFIFAVHVPIAGLALLPLLFGLPILFAPVHIAFLEMVIDPVCSLVFEDEPDEADVMRQPPRDPAAPLFSGDMIAWGLLQGMFAFVLIAVIFVIALRIGMPEDEVRTLTFFSLVVSIVALIFVNRSMGSSLPTIIRRPNRALNFALPIIALMMAVTLLWTGAAALFRFGPLRWDVLLVPLGAGIVVLAGLELLKPLWRAAFARPGRRLAAAGRVS